MKAASVNNRLQHQYTVTQLHSRAAGAVLKRLNNSGMLNVVWQAGLCVWIYLDVLTVVWEMCSKMYKS